MAATVLEHREIVDMVQRMISASLSCNISSVDDRMLQLAKECAMRDLHLHAFDSSRVPTAKDATCPIERPLEIGISASDVAASGPRMIVMNAEIGGRRVIMKFATPLRDSRPNPFEKNGKTEDVIFETIALSVLTATRLAGINPFVPVTYGAFLCTAARVYPHTVEKKDGVSFYQEHIPFDVDSLIGLHSTNASHFIDTIALVACAVFTCTHVCGIVHNDMHQHNVRYALLPSSDVTVEWRGKIHQLNTKLLPVIIDWGFACSRHLRGACSSIFDEITEYTKDARREGDVDFGHFMRCISLINIGKKLVLAAVVDALQYASGAQTAESVIAHVVINHVLWSSWVVFDAEPPHFAFDPNVSTGVSHSAFFARGYKRRPDRIFCRSIDMLDLLLALRPVVERRGTSHFALDPCAVAPPAGEYEDNIDVADGHGNTMLHLHLQDARNFDRSSVMSLIARGANINAKNNNGETPLHIAVLHSQPIEVVNALIAAGADVNAADNHGITLLFLSVTKMTEQITYALLSAGARVDVAYPVNGNTVLHAAVSKYDVGVLRALIERGADVNAKNASSKTPLHIAVSRGNVDFARELVKGGADVNTPLVDGATCLHIAILSRNDALAALLIRAGAHVNAKMPTEGETPLHAATRTNMVDIVRMLIANGANVNAETTLGKTALHIAAEDNKSAIVTILIDNGANVNAQTFSGIAPLHISVANQHIVITQMLVSAGANVQLRKRDGTTPMDIAMRDRLPEIVAILSASKTAQLAEDEYGDEDELISPISDFTDDDDDDGGGGRAHSSAAAADAAPHT